MLDDNATKALERIIRAVKLNSTRRLSIERVSRGTSSPANKATTAVTVTACPASASDTPRSAAIGVNRLAGRYSAVSSPKTPMASENTATHADEEGSPLPPSTESGVFATSTTLLLITDPSAFVQPRV